MTLSLQMYALQKTVFYLCSFSINYTEKESSSDNLSEWKICYNYSKRGTPKCTCILQKYKKGVASHGVSDTKKIEL